MLFESLEPGTISTHYVIENKAFQTEPNNCIFLKTKELVHVHAISFLTEAFHSVAQNNELTLLGILIAEQS